MRSSSEGCKCCLLALLCEALCVWGIPGRLCGPDWQTGQWWVTAYHKGKTSLCVGCMGSSSLCGCSHVHTHVWGPTENKFSFFTFRTRLSRRSTSPLHHLSMLKRYQWGQSDIHESLSGRHSFGARRNESSGLSSWTRAFIQRLHRAIFQRALLTPPLRLLHVERDLILCTTES